MNVSYQHVNPTDGGGSYLLRLREETRETTACFLVDSGAGVDLDAVLGPDEHLVAALLTHAHLDHYATLADSLRDAAPVYASRATAEILGDVLTEGEKNYDIGGSDGVLDALEPVDGWETVFPDVAVCPVPAGHAPGAAGFVVRFREGDRANHLLFTGDFTTRPVAGYPGFPTDLPVDVDALFVNVSTDDDFEATLTDSLFAVAERAHAGSSVLVTASALTGVHYAYLLGHLGDRLGNPLPVTLAGQVAKLYADLDYDAPNVEAVPVFEDPSDLLERGTVTLAGPEVPAEGSAERLFGAVADDSSAVLVQLTGGATDPIESAACTVHDYEVVNHPSAAVVDDLVERLDPIHVVVGHGPRRTVRTYRGRYDERFVWASDDDREGTLYADGRWSPPPWLSENAVQAILAQDWRSNGGRLGDFADDDASMPAVSRADDPDLEAEGVDVERFERRFGERDATGEESSEPGASLSEAVTPAEPATPAPATSGSPSDADDAFRREVLDRLESLEAAVAGEVSVGDGVGTERVRARVVDCGEDVTLLRLLDDADLHHGDEVTVAIPLDE